MFQGTQKQELFFSDYGYEVTLKRYVKIYIFYVLIHKSISTYNNCYNDNNKLGNF